MGLRKSKHEWLAVGAVLLLSACVTPARMHTQDELNAVTRQCGLALGELIQDEIEKKVLIALRNDATRRAARLRRPLGAAQRAEAGVRQHEFPVVRGGRCHFPSPRRGEGRGEGARAVRKRAVPPHPTLSPPGRGLFGAVPRVEQLVADCFQDAFGVLEHVVVPEAQDPEAECLDGPGARRIELGRCWPPSSSMAKRASRQAKSATCGPIGTCGRTWRLRSGDRADGTRGGFRRRCFVGAGCGRRLRVFPSRPNPLIPFPPPGEGVGRHGTTVAPPRRRWKPHPLPGGERAG